MRAATLFKFKVSLLGSVERAKRAFQEAVSDKAALCSNKAVIGVSHSGLTTTVESLNARVQVSLWDVSCESNFCVLRSGFCQGSKGFVVVLDELTMDQVPLYFSEIEDQFVDFAAAFVVLVEYASPAEVFKELGPLNEVASVASGPKEVIEWLVAELVTRLPSKGRPNSGLVSCAAFVIPRESLLKDPLLNEERSEYVPPAVDSRDFNPTGKVNREALVRVLQEAVGLPRQAFKNGRVFLDHGLGSFEVQLHDGGVFFTPRSCVECGESCQRRRHVCLVATCRGYSNVDDVGQRELVIASKVYALLENRLPLDVAKELKRFGKCTSKPFR
ncbi:MAG: hypothetical protein Kow0069_25110 [Promethearchaeota archaeon]